MQYLTLAADASCELPNAIYQRYDLATLPLNWLGKSMELPPDDRSDVSTDYWYHCLTSASPKGLHRKTSDALIRNVLNRDTHLSEVLDRAWLLNSDGALIITPAQHRHPGYHHWKRQTVTLLPQLERVRHAASLPPNYRLRVVDSGQTLAAYGLLCYEIARLHRDQGLTIDQLRLPLTTFASTIRHVYTVPAFAHRLSIADTRPFPGVNWLRGFSMNRQKDVPVFQSIGERETLVGRTSVTDPVTAVVDLVSSSLEKARLRYPTVNISYAGDLKPLHKNAAMRRLHATINQQDGHLWLSKMSGTSAALYGMHALSAALVN